MERATLNLYPIDYPFETLVTRADAEPAKLILNPEFQRKYKWDKDGFERASRFIESCLMRIPLPACYFAENEHNNHLVIDGVQRITTIKRFFNDEFALEGLTVYPQLNGQKFSELGELQSELESTTIRCIILRKENPKELVHEIFARLNQGAVRLSDQEIRHAIYPGNLDKLLIELGDIEFIKNFQKSAEREDRSNEELILRFLALDDTLEEYDGRLAKWLDRYMQQHQNLEQDAQDGLRNTFNATLDRCLRTFDRPFVDTTLEKPRQSIAYYDLLMWSFNNLSDQFIDANRENLNRKFQELCALPEFKKTMSGGLQQKSSIITRRNLWVEKLREIDGYDQSV
ncbi:DUF262 domain-containing protein [Flavobacterium sp. J372]|uniref:DUF262 domain-containing protein n=1 Tax=Flavobacterium sp. J372 TaxID=2898436 RepID=UPI00215181D7|nr:DUF262 domain-containing protein [Flavobacterium sp. J372]MCR5862735.1 DUF262 domain-containing protein [Flavobacterium sp. J372]